MIEVKKIEITPTDTWALEFSELKNSRQLLYFFTWRNFIVRYKQTVLGVLWAVFKPLISMIIYVAVFSRITNLSEQSPVPYPVFMFTGLLFWQFFSQGANMVSGSLLAYQGIIKKIYFPRLLAPISTALTGLVDFFLALMLYVVLLIVFQVPTQLIGWLLLPLLILLSFISIMGLGLFAAALNIKYRDVQQLLPFILQLGFFVTPVVYSRNILPESIQWILFVNPMAGIIELARSLLLGVGSPSLLNVSISMLSMTALLILGIFVFKKAERDMGDVI